MKATIQRSLARSLFYLCVLATCALPIQATSVILPSDEEMVTGARAIVRGQVTNIASGYDEAHHGIFTYITLQVSEVYKGALTTGTLVLKEPGGVSREQGSLIYGVPSFTVGEEVLLYLDTWPDGSLRVYQWFLGKFKITPNLSTGKPMVTREVPTSRVEIVGRSAAGAITDRLELETYIGRLRKLIPAKLIAGRQHEARFYANVPLLAHPQEMTATVSNPPIPLFTVINPSQPPRWFEPDSGQQVIFKINPTGAFNAQAVNDVLAAMNAWSTVSGSAIRIANGGTTGGCGLTLRDGENTISFNNCDNYSAFAPSPGSTCSGILAAAGIINYSLVQTRVVNGLTFYRALEGNLSFNPYAACYFSNSCNVAEVATHELGHALGLGHSLDTTATMYAYAHFDGRCAGLRADDMDAIRFIYPGTGVTPSPTPTPVPTPTPTPIPVTITTTTLTSGQTGAAYTQTLTATGGTTPYNWSVIAGVLPNGLSLGANGVISGTPAQASTFNFTVRVSAANGLSAQRALSITIIALPPPPPPPPVGGGKRAVRGDFDGDGKTDLGLWRGSSGLWSILKSGTNTMQTANWGTSSAPYYDMPAPGDYDGDGKVDGAVWRPNEGNWYVVLSSTGGYFIQRLGQSGDTPVPGDYDGDRVTDLAVWRASTGLWTIRESSTGQTRTAYFGAGYAPYYDVPVPGDFDGDGRYDLAVWRQSNGYWFISESSTGQARYFQLGQSGDQAVPGDYDGDGRCDAATWRGTTGLWSIRQSTTGTVRTVTWGSANSPYRDVPEPGDYDGDGKLDIAIWRPLNGTWYILLSSINAYRIQTLGQNGDTPLPLKQP
ncbi:MAG: VCBS repeat-containing protein [Acidobacteria bacterium]|nr:VCBS repeat-containing protein [Acidobacteriota bacterium]MBI3427059.1 VCBS repeat-containing protein [Acidobacteriota bacterium]